MLTLFLLMTIRMPPCFARRCVFVLVSRSYVSGDFMLHFAGKKGRVRTNLVDYYYPLAAKVQTHPTRPDPTRE